MVVGVFSVTNKVWSYETNVSDIFSIEVGVGNVNKERNATIYDGHDTLHIAVGVILIWTETSCLMVECCMMKADFAQVPQFLVNEVEVGKLSSSYLPLVLKDHSWVWPQVTEISHWMVATTKKRDGASSGDNVRYYRSRCEMKLCSSFTVVQVTMNCKSHRIQK